MDDLILVAGSTFSFFSKTRDYLTAVKLSMYSLPEDDFGALLISSILTVGSYTSYPFCFSTRPIDIFTANILATDYSSLFLGTKFFYVIFLA